ncbi:MAG: HDOD domain-containing protein, partial [Pseudomonadales bacterium]
KTIRPQLDVLWRHSAHVAAYAYVITRKQTKLNADTALLAGLLHDIGKLYIWSRAGDHADLLADPGTVEVLVNDWHSAVGKSILESWGFADEVANAAEDHEELYDLDLQAENMLSSIVAVANCLANTADTEAANDMANSDEMQPFRRLRLDGDKLAAFLGEFGDEIEDMRKAISS